MRRYQVLIESDFPTELAGMFKNLENKGNPWGPERLRAYRLDRRDGHRHPPVFGKDVESFEGFEYLFWVAAPAPTRTARRRPPRRSPSFSTWPR